MSLVKFLNDSTCIFQTEFPQYVRVPMGHEKKGFSHSFSMARINTRHGQSSTGQLKEMVLKITGT